MNEIDNNRQLLIRTAHDMFMRLGLKSVSMDDIAREMGASKKTIYQIVENKEALVRLVMTENACEDVRIVTKNHIESRDAIDEFLRNSRFFIRQMRAISPATLRDMQKYYPGIWKDQMKAHHEAFRQSVANNLERGMEEGLYRDDLDSDIVAKLYVGMIMMIIDTSIFPAQDRTISEIISQHTKYHFSGIANQFGRDRLEEYLKQEALD